MRRSLYNTIRTILVLALALSFLAGANKPVQAETCTWLGGTNNDWSVASNWSCGVPDITDDVIIPSGTTNEPTIPVTTGVTVNTITINSGATLTILKGSVVNAATWTINGALVANAADSPISLNSQPWPGGGVMNVSSTGSITKLGLDDLFICAALNNAGSVIFNEHGSGYGGVALIRGGTHTGIFQGEYLFVGNDYEASGQVFNFNSGSQLHVNQLHARGGTVNILGTYSPPVTGSYLFLTNDNGSCVVHILDGADVLRMAETTNINSGGKLILESQSYDYSMPKVSLDYNGELQNNDDLTITTQFNWLAGKLTGNGTTTVDDTATFTMGMSVYSQNDFTLDNQTLINNSTANWNKRDLTFVNSATFVNNGTFNANETTTMTGGETVTFTNNGTFFKNTPATTTTMNVGFINDGDVQINEGNLEFLLGMDNGDDTTIVLNGGRLDPGDELLLESGDSLIGSGTLTANLVNTGTVSPGASPGIITVDGDYTQQADGILEIQLGGTTPSLFDRLIVTGAASMAGTLNVTLLPGFSPQEGDTFFIVNHLTSGTGNFSIENLPDLPGSLMFEIDYADPGVTLTVVSRSTDTFIFLPMIIK